MLDTAIPVVEVEVADSIVPGQEAVGDKDGHILAREKISHILIDKISFRGAGKLGKECTPSSWLRGWGKDLDYVKIPCDGFRNFHLTVEELNDRELHSFGVIFKGLLSFQVSNIFTTDWRKTKNSFCRAENLESCRISIGCSRCSEGLG